MRNVLSRRPSRWVAVLAAGVFVASVGTVSVVVANRAGCDDAAKAPIVESEKFAPYGHRLSRMPDVAIGGAVDKAGVPSRATYAVQAIGGLSRQVTIDSANGSVYSYFFDGDTSGMMHDEFVKLGGIELDQDAGGDSFAAYILKELGERAVPIQVGFFEGALTWADPGANGIRTHNLYWFDGTYNYALIGDRSASDLVNLGRQLVCG